jgi:hypothetical protein
MYVGQERQVECGGGRAREKAVVRGWEGREDRTDRGYEDSRGGGRDRDKRQGKIHWITRLQQQTDRIAAKG